MVTEQELSAIVTWTIITSGMSIAWSIGANIGRRKKRRKEQRNDNHWNYIGIFITGFLVCHLWEDKVREETHKEFLKEMKKGECKGKWISHIEQGIYGGIQCWVCSECRELFSHDAETGIEITDYRICPNCGAEMKGAER